jgi:ABC-2 type transport system ATP-binding protein
VLTEVQRVCDRVALIRQGNIIIQAPVAEIRQMAPRRVTVIFDADVPPPASSGNWTIETVAPRHWTILVKGPTGALTRALAALPVADLQIQEPSLEDALRQYYVVIK